MQPTRHARPRPTSQHAIDANIDQRHTVTTSIINGFYADDLELTIDQQGEGRPVLLLHGGGGPPSMGALPSALSESFEVIAPVHPGFAGTPRPGWFIGIDDIALTYLQLLEQRDVSDVLVVGSSIGGWIASEMSVREHQRISGTVLLDAVGINVEGIELADFFSRTPQELIRYAFHDPAAAPDPARLPPEARDVQAANAATLAVHAREPYMHDPKLRRRLALVPTPVAAIWGESDQIAPEPYGRAYAASFANGRFEPIPHAGHLPHLEQPEQVLDAIHRFADETNHSATRQPA
jgi:pimeloyl-ACP methyl ester carboxylesterase